jgi:PHP family Zn ribbon phosphoesterase
MPDASVKCPKCGQMITNGVIPKTIHARICKGK